MAKNEWTPAPHVVNVVVVVGIDQVSTPSGFEEQGVPTDTLEGPHR
jgi:hypothetical protein